MSVPSPLPVMPDARLFVAQISRRWHFQLTARHSPAAIASDASVAYFVDTHGKTVSLFVRGALCRKGRCLRVMTFRLKSHDNGSRSAAKPFPNTILHLHRSDLESGSWRMTTRRKFLSASLAVTGAALLPSRQARPDESFRFAKNPFTLGIASGYPTPGRHGALDAPRTFASRAGWRHATGSHPRRLGDRD